MGMWVTGAPASYLAAQVPAVSFTDVLATAIGQLRANPLRAVFTLLGIIVSVAFLVTVVAVIQGLNAYVRDNVAGAVVGANAFQVRRTPLVLSPFDDEALRRAGRRPRITEADVEAVRAAVPEAVAVSVQSGWPTPLADLRYGSTTVGDVTVFGVSPEYQVVQDYRVREGRALLAVDVTQRRAVGVLGAEVADKLFGDSDPVGKTVRVGRELIEVVGVMEPKGRVLGQSFDGFILLPISRFEMLYGRRLTTTISVKLAEAVAVPPAMARAEEAVRLARRLRPGQDNDFSVETSEALVAFWRNITALLFSVIPAVVAIGVVVGGIVIMNVMLMAVTERMREIGIRKAVGARARDIERQFLAEAVLLASLGGLLGAAAGWAFATTVAALTPLPARVTTWSVLLALAIGLTVGIVFGVVPARRAARLDPIRALHRD
jgi:putative ABC transport system permease protein